jgi:AcrR family transcriptional regulator
MYAYFPSKRDIIVAVAKEHMKEVYAFIDMLEVSKKPIALLIAAAQEEVSAKPDALEIEIFAEAMRNPDVMDVFKAADESFRRVLKGVFMQLGKSNVKAEALADYISSIFDGLRMRKTLNASSDSKRLVHMFEQTLDVLIA